MAKRYDSFMIDPDLADALKTVKERDGVGEGEQIRQALRDWFRRKQTVCPVCGRGGSGKRMKRGRAKR